ncbi:uncharacterized protein CBL_02386 [Carabus blaptoides fortunei]
MATCGMFRVEVFQLETSGYVREGTTSTITMQPSTMIRETMGNSPSSPPYPGYPSHSPYVRRASPPGSPAPKKCCFERKDPYPKESFLCCCYTCPAARKTSVFASIGVCFLVIAYTIIGAFTFMALEGGIHHETAVAASKPSPNRESTLVSELRSHTVDRLWSITENLNILYRENWTRLAAEEVMEFQEALVRALRTSGGGAYVASARGGTMYYTHEHRWSFSSSFLYSLTLITTIGSRCRGAMVSGIYSLPLTHLPIHHRHHEELHSHLPLQHSFIYMNIPICLAAAFVEVIVVAVALEPNEEIVPKSCSRVRATHFYRIAIKPHPVRPHFRYSSPYQFTVQVTCHDRMFVAPPPHN